MSTLAVYSLVLGANDVLKARLAHTELYVVALNFFSSVFLFGSGLKFTTTFASASGIVNEVPDISVPFNVTFSFSYPSLGVIVKLIF